MRRTRAYGSAAPPAPLCALFLVVEVARRNPKNTFAKAPSPRDLAPNAPSTRPAPAAPVEPAVLAAPAVPAAPTTAAAPVPPVRAAAPITAATRARRPTIERVPGRAMVRRRIQPGTRHIKYSAANTARVLNNPPTLGNPGNVREKLPGVSRIRTTAAKINACTVGMASTPNMARHQPRAIASRPGRAWQHNASGAATIRIARTNVTTIKTISSVNSNTASANASNTRYTAPPARALCTSSAKIRPGFQLSRAIAAGSAAARVMALLMTNQDRFDAANPSTTLGASSLTL